MSTVHFPAIQEELYRAKCRYERELEQIRAKYSLSKPQKCIYPTWNFLRGRGKFGEFPIVVVREYYRRRGYTVWVSGSDGRGADRFILVSYPGLRNRKSPHPAYKRILRIFGRKKVEKLNEVVARAKAKTKKTRNLGGGDPDLFMFKKVNPTVEGFFVEVKHKDKFTRNQRICFPLIDKNLCKVKLVRIVAKD